MNVSPTCEQCRNRAEWHIIDKTDGSQRDCCNHHLHLTPGHTYSIFPARSYAKSDGVGLTLGEARSKHVCRVCGEKDGPRRRSDGSPEPFVLGYGFEYAHEDCLSEGDKQRMRHRISETAPHAGD